jgi:hypothetical protein
VKYSINIIQDETGIDAKVHSALGGDHAVATNHYTLPPPGVVLAVGEELGRGGSGGGRVKSHIEEADDPYNETEYSGGGGGAGIFQAKQIYNKSSADS